MNGPHTEAGGSARSGAVRHLSSSRADAAGGGLSCMTHNS